MNSTISFHRLRWHIFVLALPIISALMTSTPSYAAQECKIEYGYHNGRGINSIDNVVTLALNAGQTKNINQSQMNYVKNLNTQAVKFKLQGSKTISLGKNAINPPSGVYRSSVTLKTVSCLNLFRNPKAMIEDFKQRNRSVEEIAVELKTQFNVAPQQASQLLKEATFSATDAAKALRPIYHPSNQHLAQWLKAAGYSGKQVILALNSDQQISAQVTANIIKKLFRTSASQLAQWLKTANYTAIQTAQALAPIEPDAQKVMHALKSSFNLSANQLLQTLKKTKQLVTPKNCHKNDCQQPARYLKNIGYALSDVVKALKSQFNIPVEAAYDIAKNVYRANNVTTQQALAYAGYSAQQITSVIS